MFRLVRVAEDLTRTPAQEILEAFGEHLVKGYLALYGNLLKGEWRTLDVMRHRGDHPSRGAYAAARRRATAARGDTAPDEVVLFYDSPRRLCAVARGIGRGVANHSGNPSSSTSASALPGVIPGV